MLLCFRLSVQAYDFMGVDVFVSTVAYRVLIVEK